MGTIEGNMSLALEAGAPAVPPAAEEFTFNPDVMLRDLLFCIAPSLSSYHSGVTQDGPKIGLFLDGFLLSKSTKAFLYGIKVTHPHPSCLLLTLSTT